ncbi:polymorphic toxin-type HINT domain-containing protein [Streptomyces sp. NPDC088729]|uniref:polymorphic toxin-type HINT domain-containing protein n=1 Tax=Streptomyces sp. NPDC088729 TaxID=3365876 RepID=UPI0038188CEF
MFLRLRTRHIALSVLLAAVLSVPAPSAPFGTAATAAERPGRPDVPQTEPAKVTEVTSPRAKGARDKAAKEKSSNQELVDSASAERRSAWPKGSQATSPITAKPASGDALIQVRAEKPGSDIDRQARSRASGQAKITVLDQKATGKLGITGIVFSAAAERPGAAEITVDYSSFASAVGGNWSSRLGLVSLPACALITPERSQCRTRTAQTADNDVQEEQVTAQVSLAGTSDSSAAPTVFAVTATSATTSTAGSGDFKATPLAASASWQAGSASGAFSWSYPLATPPAAAGPSPSLSLTYDSGSIDGRTANTNNQGSLVGEGFDLTSSYIERKYGPCEDDGHTDKFDLCWKYDNAALVLNGKATELVKDDTTGNWHLKDDDASKVTRHTGAANAEADGGGNGEYWTVVTGDGTTHNFGLDKLPGAGSQRTNSVWTAPVFGDDSGEPGYTKGSEFKSRSETQAWRWNLDLTQDVHGNAATYWYKKETNNYAKNGDKTNLAAYDRGGYLEEIRYGQRADTLFTGQPSNKITLSYKERCTATGTGCDSLTTETADNWPDVPFDTICSTSETDCEAFGPSFFTRKRLTSVDTFFWSRAAEPDAYQPVDSYALGQKFFDGQDIGNSSDQVLTLTSLTRTGKNGTAVSSPPIEFTYHQRPNRVDSTSDDILPLTRPRIASVISETGAITSVTLSEPECVRGSSMPAAEDDNDKSCYPVYWPVNGGDMALDWFNKYRVTAITTNDPAAGNPGTQLSYSYSTPGWHYSDDPFTKEKHRTWSEWRGYQKVTTYSGDAGATRSKSVKLFMQGMHGDKRKNGTTRTAVIQGIDLDNVAGNDPATTGDDLDVSDVDDHDYYAGSLRQEIVYDGATAISTTINDLWSKQTASQQRSYANTKAYFVRTARTYNDTYLTTARSWRVNAASHAYDTTYGMATMVEDHGNWSASGDETCTRTWYARNAGKGLTSLVSRTRTVAKPCAATDDTLSLPSDNKTRGDVLADAAVVYDNPAATGWTAVQAPTLGLSTWSGRPTGYPAASGTADRDPSASGGWQTLSTTTYDTDTAKLGRPLKVTDTEGKATTTAYYPAAAGPLGTSVVTQPKLSSNGQAHQTTTVYDPARGAVSYTLDVNAKRTEYTYDALGRATATWLPDRSKTAGDSPDAKYAYGLERDKAPWSSVSTLNADGTTYETAYSIFDSQLRPLQVQTPSPNGGRLLTDTRYDTRGLAYETYEDVYDNTKGPSSTYAMAQYGDATQTLTQFDGAGRATTSKLLVDGVQKVSTTTAYTGDSVATTAPTGGNATRTITDALGRTVETRTYAGTSPTDTGFGGGTGTPYTSTTFTYTRDGQPATVTGPDKATWTYTYDLYGREVKTVDPDKGTTLTGYNARDAVDTVQDAENRILLYTYDELGRQTDLWKTARADVNKLASWSYDSVLKGLPTASTRHVNGVGQSNSKAYTQEVKAYDVLGRPTTTSLTLPADDPLVTNGAVASTTTHEVTYRLDGTVNTTKEPAVGGLPAETLTHRYNATGQQTELSGASKYLLAASYTGLGQVGQLQLGTSAAEGTKRVFLTQTYEEGTGRLLNAAVDDQTRGPVQDLAYTYDQVGNVTAITDNANIGTGVDRQCFTYDAYRRLADAWTPKTTGCSTADRTTANLGGPAPYWNSYTYTDSGQRKTEKNNTTTPATTRTSCYDPTRPHAMTATTTGSTCTGVAAQYAYDKTGNTTKRVESAGSAAKQDLAWDEEGNLARLTDSGEATATNYLYDADGQLLIRRDNATDGETVLYLGATEVHLKTGKKWANRYYTAAGATVALRTNESGTEKLSFLASDHHSTGSVSLTADSAQALTKRFTTPFGTPRGTTTGVWPDDKAFLGMSADTDTGLTHIGAREYDPTTGQFVSVDPLLQIDLHQTLNGYAYPGQNPVTVADPTGLGVPECHRGELPCTNGVPDTQKEIKEKEKIVAETGGTIAGHDYTPPKPSPTWENEGSAKVDIDNDGYINLLPGVYIPAEWHGTGKFIDHFYSHLNGLTIYGIDFYAEHQDSAPYVKSDVNKALLSACRETGCPSKKEFFYNWFGSNVVAGISAGAGRGGTRPGQPRTCPNSFLAGADVLMADGTVKDIEDIEEGDLVLATDPETGETAPRKVTHLIRTQGDKNFNELSISADSGVEKIAATFEHPFWSPSEQRWVLARALTVGMSLQTEDAQTALVIGNRAFEKRERTYNLTIADLHTYYVLAGETPVLVHNSNGACGTNLTRGEKVAAATGVDDLSPALRKSLTGFMKKSPGNAEIPQIVRLPEGGAEFYYKVPGRVPGSYAMYRKRVDPEGVTELAYKTTFLPDGSIAHIKFK